VLLALAVWLLLLARRVFKRLFGRGKPKSSPARGGGSPQD
jgi:hypothetical protein